jgi:hypothetical protein
MKQIVFYSWQSDLPNSCNRGFIQEALENAAAAITADEAVAIDPVIDRDTQGVPGAPDIASTIFSKITAADAFVADVSPVGKLTDGGRASPNPNVLIELGYALKALGPERVILVFNRAFGRIEELPFDLRTRRLLAYEMPAEGKPKGPERKTLEKHLQAAICAALANAPRANDSVPIQAVTAIENAQSNRTIVLRRDLGKILTELDKLHPRKHVEGGTVEELITALGPTQEPVAEFSKIAESIAVIDDATAAAEVVRWFGGVFEKLDLPENFSGRFTEADHDYFRFVGHELVVTFVAFLLREQRWDTLDSMLKEPVPVRYLRREHGPGNVSLTYGSQHVSLLLGESQRRRRMSLHADILHERHTTGGLASILPFDDFVAADYFLFLAGEMWGWRPWSALYLKRAPMFLLNAERGQVAKQLMKIFGASTLDELKKGIGDHTAHLRELFSNGMWFSPLTKQNIEGIGTR